MALRIHADGEALLTGVLLRAAVLGCEVARDYWVYVDMPLPAGHLNLATITFILVALASLFHQEFEQFADTKLDEGREDGVIGQSEG